MTSVLMPLVLLMLLNFFFPEWGGAPPHSGKKKFEKVHEMVCGKGRIKCSCDSSMIVVFSCEKAACNLTY